VSVMGLRRLRLASRPPASTPSRRGPATQSHTAEDTDDDDEGQEEEEEREETVWR